MDKFNTTVTSDNVAIDDMEENLVEEFPVKDRSKSRSRHHAQRKANRRISDISPFIANRAETIPDSESYSEAAYRKAKKNRNVSRAARRLNKKTE